MIPITFNGAGAFIFNDAPNWKSGFETTFSAITDIQDGLTKIESRRPYSLFLRTKVKFSLTLSDDSLINFQGQMRALNTQPVLLPFWPAIEYWPNRAGQAIGGGLYIAWKPDWSVYTVYEAGSPEPSWPTATDYVAPVVMGYLKSNTNALLSPTLAQWKFEFAESSPANYALSITPDMSVGRTDGPKPVGYTTAPVIFPFTPDWSNVAEDFRIDIKRDQIGFERPVETTFYPHDVYRVNQSQYTLADQDLFNILEFFASVASQGASFWTVGSYVSAKLSSPALSTDTSLSMVDASGLLVSDYLAYANSGTVLFARITGISGNTVTIDNAFGVALPAAFPFFNLQLARLDKPQMIVSWTSLTLMKAKFTWSEVRPERLIPGTETLGVTMGQLPTRATLFKFTRDFANGSTQNWYFTSAEIDIPYAGQTYLSRGIELGDVTSSLNMENDSATITSFVWTGNPMIDDMAMTVEAPLAVTATHVEFDGFNWGNPTQLFSGDCTTINRDGSKLRAQCKFGSSLFETELPRFVRGTMCNHIGGSNNDGSFLISAGCTLLKADWKFTATVANTISNAFPYTLNLASLTGVGTNAAAALAVPALFLNWFANGWVEWGAGIAIQRRMVIGSTVPSAGAITLTLHRYFKSLPGLGDAVTIYPGCDGLFTTCRAYDAIVNPTGKFNNKVNFGGEPFTPIANPSANGLPSLNTQGSKK